MIRPTTLSRRDTSPLPSASSLDTSTATRTIPSGPRHGRLRSASESIGQGAAGGGADGKSHTALFPSSNEGEPSSPPPAPSAIFARRALPAHQRQQQQVHHQRDESGTPVPRSASSFLHSSSSWSSGTGYSADPTSSLPSTSSSLSSFTRNALLSPPSSASGGGWPSPVGDPFSSVKPVSPPPTRPYVGVGLSGDALAVLAEANAIKERAFHFPFARRRSRDDVARARDHHEAAVAVHDNGSSQAVHVVARPSHSSPPVLAPPPPRRHKNLRRPTTADDVFHRSRLRSPSPSPSSRGLENTTNPTSPSSRFLHISSHAAIAHGDLSAFSSSSSSSAVPKQRGPPLPVATLAHSDPSLVRAALLPNGRALPNSPPVPSTTAGTSSRPPDGRKWVTATAGGRRRDERPRTSPCSPPASPTSLQHGRSPRSVSPVPPYDDGDIDFSNVPLSASSSRSATVAATFHDRKPALPSLAQQRSADSAGTLPDSTASVRTSSSSAAGAGASSSSTRPPPSSSGAAKMLHSLTRKASGRMKQFGKDRALSKQPTGVVIPEDEPTLAHAAPSPSSQSHAAPSPSSQFHASTARLRSVSTTSTSAPPPSYRTSSPSNVAPFPARGSGGGASPPPFSNFFDAEDGSPRATTTTTPTTTITVSVGGKRGSVRKKPVLRRPATSPGLPSAAERDEHYRTFPTGGERASPSPSSQGRFHLRSFGTSQDSNADTVSMSFALVPPGPGLGLGQGDTSPSQARVRPLNSESPAEGVSGIGAGAGARAKSVDEGVPASASERPRNGMDETPRRTGSGEDGRFETRELSSMPMPTSTATANKASLDSALARERAGAFSPLSSVQRRSGDVALPSITTPRLALTMTKTGDATASSSSSSSLTTLDTQAQRTDERQQGEDQNQHQRGLQRQYSLFGSKTHKTPQSPPPQPRHRPIPFFSMETGANGRKDREEKHQRQHGRVGSYQQYDEQNDTIYERPVKTPTVSKFSRFLSFGSGGAGGGERRLARQRRSEEAFDTVASPKPRGAPFVPDSRTAEGERDAYGRRSSSVGGGGGTPWPVQHQPDRSGSTSSSFSRDGLTPTHGGREPEASGLGRSPNGDSITPSPVPVLSRAYSLPRSGTPKLPRAAADGSSSASSRTMEGDAVVDSPELTRECFGGDYDKTSTRSVRGGSAEPSDGWATAADTRSTLTAPEAAVDTLSPGVFSRPRTRGASVEPRESTDLDGSSTTASSIGGGGGAFPAVDAASTSPVQGRAQKDKTSFEGNTPWPTAAALASQTTPFATYTPTPLTAPPRPRRKTLAVEQRDAEVVEGADHKGGEGGGQGDSDTLPMPSITTEDDADEFDVAPGPPDGSSVAHVDLDSASADPPVTARPRSVSLSLDRAPSVSLPATPKLDSAHQRRLSAELVDFPRNDVEWFGRGGGGHTRSLSGPVDPLHQEPVGYSRMARSLCTPSQSPELSSAWQLDLASIAMPASPLPADANEAGAESACVRKKDSKSKLLNLFNRTESVRMGATASSDLDSACVTGLGLSGTGSSSTFLRSPRSNSSLTTTTTAKGGGPAVLVKPRDGKRTVAVDLSPPTALSDLVELRAKEQKFEDLLRKSDREGGTLKLTAATSSSVL